MIEHPDFTRNFAVAHYNDLLQDAERIRRIRAFESGHKAGGVMKTLNNWSNDLKFWARPVRNATTRA